MPRKIVGLRARWLLFVLVPVAAALVFYGDGRHAGVPEAGAAVTYDVTTNADPGDNTCDATCSLRAAITAANTSAGADMITFSIGTGAQTIAVSSDPLPDITGAVTIDGTTQEGFTARPSSS